MLQLANRPDFKYPPAQLCLSTAARLPQLSLPRGVGAERGGGELGGRDIRSGMETARRNSADQDLRELEEGSGRAAGASRWTVGGLAGMLPKLQSRCRAGQGDDKWSGWWVVGAESALSFWPHAPRRHSICNGDMFRSLKGPSCACLQAEERAARHT